MTNVLDSNNSLDLNFYRFIKITRIDNDGWASTRIIVLFNP